MSINSIVADPITTEPPVPTQTVVLPGDNTADYILVAISLILLILFWVWVMYVLRDNPPVSQVYFQCPLGMCATNIYNGEKRCPVSSTDSVTYDASYETCNSRYTCESSLTPYALSTDGSTNSLGVCDTLNICRCLRYPQCSPETCVLFNMTNGSTYVDTTTSSRVVWTQTPLSSQGFAGSQILTFSNPNTQTCAIKAYHLNRLSPGACIFVDPDAPTTQEVRICLQQTNPCVVGVAAFHPINVSQFVLNAQNTDAIYTIPVACVPGVRNEALPAGTYYCSGTSLPVWDSATASVICYDVGV